MNKDNVIIQKAGLVATNSKSFHILIGTKDLDKEQYTVQVSTNKSFTPMGFGQFKVKGEIPFVIPLLIAGMGSNPKDVIGDIKKKTKDLKDGIRKKLTKKDIDDHVIRKQHIRILQIKYKTMMDSKVDSACKIYENKVYDVGDESMPSIPIHFNCRCHYEILDIRRSPVKQEIVPLT